MTINRIYVMLVMSDIYIKKTIYRLITYMLKIQDEYYLIFMVEILIDIRDILVKDDIQYVLIYTNLEISDL